MRIIYFDGICNLCHSFVDFVIRNDTDRKFFFASLQGQRAKNELSLPDLSLDSVVLSVDGVHFRKSKAVLLIFNELGFCFKLLSLLGNLFPTRAADFIYDLVAKNRYHFFGKKAVCRLPTSAEQNQLLD